MNWRLSLVACCVVLCCSICIGEPADFRFIGDKPDAPTKIPDGWEELKFTAPAVDGVLLYQQGGISVTAHHYQEPVMPKTPFSITGKKKNLSAIATLGEYEPVAFTVKSSRKIQNCRIHLSEFGMNGRAGTIGTVNLELRRVDFRPRNNDIPLRLQLSNMLPKKKYIMAPILLVKDEVHQLPTNENRTFWLTIYVPPASGPGLHTGSVNLRLDSKEIRLPMRLQVLPFRIETEVSKLDSHYGGYHLMLVDNAASAKVALNDKEMKALRMACIYIADTNISNPSARDYFFIYYTDTQGNTITFGSDKQWKQRWHSTGVPWQSDKSYRFVAERKAGAFTFSIFSGGKVLVETLPVKVASVRNGDGACNFILGDGMSSYSNGSMLVNKLIVNGILIRFREAFADVPVQKMVGADLPYTGLFYFGKHTGYIQVPPDYNPAKKYPFIIFFHGRGGNTIQNNFLVEEFSTFRRKVASRGYIVALPGYGNDCWMNARGEAISLEMIEFLKKRLSIDPKRFYVMGCSMGGGAALTFSMRHKEMVAAVCDIFGVTDFIRFYNEGFYNKSISGAYGASPAENPRIYRERSAIYHINDLKQLPLLIIHGSKDRVVPIWNSKTLYEKLKVAGAKVELVVVPGIGHTNAIIKGLEDKVINYFDSVGASR